MTAGVQGLYNALTAPPDLAVQDEGSIFILNPLTVAGDAWINEHLPFDVMYWCDGVVVEHRFIQDIVNGAVADGLTVEWRGLGS